MSRIYMLRQYHDKHGKVFAEQTFYKSDEFDQDHLAALLQCNYVREFADVETETEIQPAPVAKKRGRKAKYETREMTA
jgi:hypothetical protein